MQHFEQGVVTVTEDPGVELHDGATPHIVNPIFQLELAHLLKDVFEELAKVLGPFPCFRGILRQVVLG